MSEPYATASAEAACRDAAAASISYRHGNDLDLDTFIGVYRDSGLAERRPAADRSAMAAMLRHANLVVTAWEGSRLVGLSRTLTDFVHVAYLADLAVSRSHQRSGIGRELIARTREALAPTAQLVLLAAPAARAYYPHIGMRAHPSAWVLRPGEALADPAPP